MATKMPRTFYKIASLRNSDRPGVARSLPDRFLLTSNINVAMFAPTNEDSMAPRKDVADYLTRGGAQMIVDKIAAYWRSRGFHGIRAEVYPINRVGDFGVRSNIRSNGFPPPKIGRPITSGAGLR